MNRLYRISTLALALLMPTWAWAGDFTVTPVRIYMTPRDRAMAVTVVNESAADIVMQAELFSWNQKADGQDELLPTDDLVMAPPIMTVPARSRQVLRLMRLAPPPAGQQQTYRMLLREVPEAGKRPEDAGMQIALAFSLPVFITPPGAKRNMSCSPIRLESGAVAARCANTGMAYAQVRSVALLGPAGEQVASTFTPTYVLPQATRNIELQGAARVPAGKFKLLATMDDATVNSFEGNLTD